MNTPTKIESYAGGFVWGESSSVENTFYREENPQPIFIIPLTRNGLVKT